MTNVTHPLTAASEKLVNDWERYPDAIDASELSARLWFIEREVYRSATSAPLDIEALTEALHPAGEGPVVDCCMGSTSLNVHGKEEGERLHRKYHHDDAEALAESYAAVLAARQAEPEGET